MVKRRSPKPVDEMRHEMKKMLSVIVLVMLSSTAHAANPLARVKSLPIVKGFFGTEVKLVEARDLGSLYEVVVDAPGRGKLIFYLTKDGSYVLAGGTLFDKARTNVTKNRYDQINRVDLTKLPLQEAIMIKQGSGAKILVLFSDVDCPYCRKAYDWLKTQTNYTLYLFLAPLDMHPNAHDKSVKILCSEDRIAALEKAQADQEIGSDGCEAGEKALQRQSNLAGELGVSGTPLFVIDSGVRISGFDRGALAAYLKP
ncbi:MAG TPA: thiol:disulfide interchange protein [Syntrophobacteraceae bacterium]|nr:thiol:disulfide interchange protein [Syntrophobacteraceae bacterium]HBZ54570.1 thiol:disulfide interchange protein [Syntrophobacteraceae bacterium]